MIAAVGTNHTGVTTAASSRPTIAHQLADQLLGSQGATERFVVERRSQGRAWRLIARDLYEATGKAVDVTYETLRSWFPDPVEELDTPEPATEAAP